MQVKQEVLDKNTNEQGTGDPFNAPIAGESLTKEQGSLPMEGPPKFTDPEEVYVKLTQKFSKPETKEKTLELLGAGIPLEILINTIVKQAAYSRAVSPDVSEILKPSLTVFFIDMAKRENVDIIIFADDDAELKEKELEKDKMLMSTLRSQKPETLKAMRGLDFQERMKGKSVEVERGLEARREIQRREQEVPVESDGSFLEMDEE